MSDLEFVLGFHFSLRVLILFLIVIILLITIPLLYKVIKK